MNKGVPGLPVAVVAVGGLLVWSGIYNQSLTNALGAILKGQKPAPGPQVSTQVNVSSSGAPGTTSSAVANDALKYAGNRYVWGGAPGTTVGTDNGTDCSGFVNMVLGRDLKQPIPGYAAGTYTGASHGPTTVSYLLWGGAKAIPQSQLQPGDLLVWETHMGIALGGGQMISSLDTRDGVKVTSIQGGSPAGEVLFCRRLTGLSGVLPTPTGTRPAPGGGNPPLPPLGPGTPIG